MKYMLDTNICVHMLRGQYTIAQKIDEIGICNFCISEITKAELLLGERLAICKGKTPKPGLRQFIDLFKIIPITDAIDNFAEEKARLMTAGTPIEDFDLLIACSAIASNCTLVTENTSHMSRVNGLRLENWISRG